MITRFFNRKGDTVTKHMYGSRRDRKYRRTESHVRGPFTSWKLTYVGSVVYLDEVLLINVLVVWFLQTPFLKDFKYW